MHVNAYKHRQNCFVERNQFPVNEFQVTVSGCCKPDVHSFANIVLEICLGIHRNTTDPPHSMHVSLCHDLTFPPHFLLFLVRPVRAPPASTNRPTSAPHSLILSRFENNGLSTPIPRNDEQRHHVQARQPNLTPNHGTTASWQPGANSDCQQLVALAQTRTIAVTDSVTGPTSRIVTRNPPKVMCDKFAEK